jgi:hypothetical protein
MRGQKHKSHFIARSVTPTLLYGGGCWPLGNAKERRTEAEHMRSLGPLTGAPRNENNQQ